MKCDKCKKEVTKTYADPEFWLKPQVEGTIPTVLCEDCYKAYESGKEKARSKSVGVDPAKPGRDKTVKCAVIMDEATGVTGIEFGNFESFFRGKPLIVSASKSVYDESIGGGCPPHTPEEIETKQLADKVYEAQLADPKARCASCDRREGVYTDLHSGTNRYGHLLLRCRHCLNADYDVRNRTIEKLTRADSGKIISLPEKVYTALSFTLTVREKWNGYENSYTFTAPTILEVMHLQETFMAAQKMEREIAKQATKPV